MKLLSFISIFLITLMTDAFTSTSVARKVKNPFSLKTIVIDAGHGGHDTGCLGATDREKNITLEISMKLGALIEKNIPDVTVIYTRKTDVFIELYDRANIANKNNADLFISIHCNANKNTSAYGTESWVMGLHKTDANLEVAKRENSSILLEDNYSDKYDGFNPNAPESYIIFSLNQGAYIDQSIALASEVEKEFEKDGRTSRGVKQSGFLVLWKTTMPAVLIETGFLTNRAEEKILASEEGQNEIVQSIFDAVKNYKETIEGKKIEPITNDKLSVEKIELPLKVEKQEVNTQMKNENSLDSVAIKKTEPVVDKPIITNAIFYKIQIAASDKTISKTDSKFSAIKDMANDKSEKGLNRYVVGNYAKRSEAEARMKSLKTNGFKDAFLVAYKNEKRVPLDSVK